MIEAGRKLKEIPAPADGATCSPQAPPPSVCHQAPSMTQCLPGRLRASLGASKFSASLVEFSLRTPQTFLPATIVGAWSPRPPLVDSMYFVGTSPATCALQWLKFALGLDECPGAKLGLTLNSTGLNSTQLISATPPCRWPRSGAATTRLLV